MENAPHQPDEPPTTPTTLAMPQRLANGQFVRGNRLGVRGNPHANLVHKFRTAILNAVEPDTAAKLFTQLVDDALTATSVRDRRECTMAALAYLVGKPQESIALDVTTDAGPRVIDTIDLTREEESALRSLRARLAASESAEV